MKKRFYIAIRTFLLVGLTTLNIWLISNKMREAAVGLSALISILYTLNIKDLSIADFSDRTAYVIGGLAGTIFSLYVPEYIFKFFT